MTVRPNPNVDSNVTRFEPNVIMTLGTWTNVENSVTEASKTPGRQLLMFCGETLQLLTDGEFKATSHRVHTESAERLSIVYEMRTHHND